MFFTWFFLNEYLRKELFMKKLRFFGLLAVAVLLAFSLVVACDNGSTGPGDGPGDGPGTGPDSEGPAYSVPKTPGFTPTDPDDGGNGGGSNGGSNGDPDKTFTVVKDDSAIIYNDPDDSTSGVATPALTQNIKITFSGEVYGLTKDDVIFGEISGKVEKHNDDLAYVDDGGVWWIPLDKSKSKTGLITVTVKKGGVSPVPIPLGVLGPETASTITFSALTDAVTPAPSTPLNSVRWHLEKNRSIRVYVGYAPASLPSDFDPEEHITIELLPSIMGGMTEVTFGKPRPASTTTPPAAATTSQTAWDFPITSLTKQGQVVVYSTYDKVAPSVTTLNITDNTPIEYSISASKSLNNKTGTSDVLTFEFKSNPLVLYLGTTAEATFVKSLLKASPKVGDGSLASAGALDTILQAGAFARKASGNNLEWNLTLATADIPKLNGGEVWIYINQAGIKRAATPDPILDAVFVDITRAPRAKIIERSTQETVGITSGIVLKFDRPLELGAGVVPKTGDFTLTDNTKTATNAKFPGTSAEARNPSGDKVTWIFDLDSAQAIAAAGEIKIKLNPAVAATTGTEVEATEYSVNIKKDLAKYDLIPSDQVGSFKSVDGMVTIWIKFDKPMVNPITGAFLDLLKEVDITASLTSPGSFPVADDPGIDEDTDIVWRFDNILEIKFGPITGTKKAAGALAGDTDEVELNVKVVAGSGGTAATTKYIDLTVAAKKIKIQFDD